MCYLTPYKFVNWFLYYTQLIQQTKLTLHVFSAFSQRRERVRVEMNDACMQPLFPLTWINFHPHIFEYLICFEPNVHFWNFLYIRVQDDKTFQTRPILDTFWLVWILCIIFQYYCIWLFHSSQTILHSFNWNTIFHLFLKSDFTRYKR